MLEGKQLCGSSGQYANHPAGSGAAAGSCTQTAATALPSSLHKMLATVSAGRQDGGVERGRKAEIEVALQVQFEHHAKGRFMACWT